MRQSRSKRRFRRVDLLHHEIPTKANRILHLILIALGIILIRIWYLAVIQYDQKLEESRKPQQKSVIEPAARATICDRFNLPIAINKTSYQAAILYSDLRDIPSFIWQKDETGKRVKIFKRREYIHRLAGLLGEELDMDAERVEDLIHAKASYYSQVPFVLKEEISEREYYRLKAMEKEWPGIHMRRVPKRYYPRGKSGGDIIGYMGAINRQEYEKILHEIKALDLFIKERENGEESEIPEALFPFRTADIEQARKRLKDLEEKAYTIHDYVGKTGIEGLYEEQLRGFYGRKNYYTDSKGNFLWELPGTRPSLSGHQIRLTISAELQEFAEQLLAQNEELRIVRKSSLGEVKKTTLAQKHPWIKGGAIVALDPHTGEILALASYPRFDPNDFISTAESKMQKMKKIRINRWFENEHYIAQMWNQQLPFERERYDASLGSFYEESRWLTWSNYLDFILPNHSQLRIAINQNGTIDQACDLQCQIEELLGIFPNYSLYAILNLLYNGEGHLPHRPLVKSSEKLTLMETLHSHDKEAVILKSKLDKYFANLPQNYDKVLLVDLCRLAIKADHFNPELLQKVGTHSLEDYRYASGSLITIFSLLKKVSKEIFHDNDFKEWRKKNEKEFLKQKRAEEKAIKTYSKPYLDYFDQIENQLFEEFWEHAKWQIITAFLIGTKQASLLAAELAEQVIPYLSYFDRWRQEIDQGAYGNTDWHESYYILRKAIWKLQPDLAVRYLRTMRTYDELDRPLLGRYRGIRHQQEPLEKDLAAAFYPAYGYGYGRSHGYRQSTIQGSLFKAVTAYEALIQRYNKLKGNVSSFSDLNPLIISDQESMNGQVRMMGSTEDGRPIPQLYKGGRLPRSLAHRNTGRVDLIRAMEVSSNPYFSMLAGDCLEDPMDLVKAARQFGYGAPTGFGLPGEIAGKVPEDVSSNRTGLYALAIGQHSLVVTPLQTAIMLAAIANNGKVLKPKIANVMANCQEVKRELFMPHIVHKMLLCGLHSAVKRTCQESFASLAKLYHDHPEAMQQLKELKNQLIGKTSTSESVEKIDLDLEEGTNIYTHVWFGGIAYSKDQEDKSAYIFKDELGYPELVVVVYLRYGGYGKEAMPVAAQMINKWREIKQKHAAQ